MLRRAWAPHGVDRAYNLARAGYFDDSRVYRVVDGFVAQFGLAGDPTIARRQEPTPPSLLNRVNGIANSLWSNTMEDATATQKRQYDIAAGELGGLLDRLRTLVEQDLKKVEDQAETAGVPWTSGRVPVWKP